MIEILFLEYEFIQGVFLILKGLNFIFQGLIQGWQLIIAQFKLLYFSLKLFFFFLVGQKQFRIVSHLLNWFVRHTFQVL